MGTVPMGVLNAGSVS